MRTGATKENQEVDPLRGEGKGGRGKVGLAAALAGRPGTDRGSGAGSSRAVSVCGEGAAAGLRRLSGPI